MQGKGFEHSFTSKNNKLIEMERSHRDSNPSSWLDTGQNDWPDYTLLDKNVV